MSCLLSKLKTRNTHADHLYRRAAITNTPAGKEIREKLWDDIWREVLKVDVTLEPLERLVL